MIKNYWEVTRDIEQTERDYKKLAKALKIKNIDSVCRILVDQSVLRCFIIRRGESNKYLKILLNSFDFIIKNEFKTQNENIENKNIFFVINKYAFPKHILIELLSAAYHLRDKKHFFMYYDAMRNKIHNFKDKEVPVFALHTLAVWVATTEGDHEKHIELNKQAPQEARKFKCNIIEQKILYGLSDHKGQRVKKRLKPQKRIDDFRKFSDFFRKNSNIPDAIRSNIDEGNACLELMKLQNGNDREKTLKKALKICQEAQREARAIGYQNALMLVKEVLSEIYIEAGNIRQGKRYKKEFERLQEIYIK